MELFEKIRQEFEHGVGTIRGVSEKFRVHRRIVRQALKSATPPYRKKNTREAPKLVLVKSRIDEILDQDLKVVKKQRHTAHRIWIRLGEERPDIIVSESLVRTYVRKRKFELGLKGRDICIPQIYAPGQEAQIDWYEAEAILAGEVIKVQVFCMRGMFSGGSFHRAYLRATQQAFLEAHELAFRYFGGVFRTLRYDNLKSAVQKVLRGHRREETNRFLEFRSAWGFSGSFCNVAQGHEKGGVEGENGYFRRNHLVPVPQAENLEKLNEFLLSSCRQDENRRIGQRQEVVGTLMIAERGHLLPLPSQTIDLAETLSGNVDFFGCVRVKNNFYSTPLQAHTETHIRVGAAQIEIFHQGIRIAQHERLFERGKFSLNLEHYLDVFLRKPGALAGSLTLAQAREQGNWPVSYDRMWNDLQERHGKGEGTRRMIHLLRLGKQHGSEALRKSIDQAYSAGCRNIETVEHLLRQSKEKVVESLPPMEVGKLSQFNRELPTLNHFDHLLGREVH